MKSKPCDSCTKVRDPLDCEYKKCKEWETWFLDRWERLRGAWNKEVGSVVDAEK